jgi:TatD DNase family protein
VLIDSHCHLIYLDDVDARLAAARDAGVGGFLAIGVKESEHAAVSAVAARHRDVWMTAGVHPDGVVPGEDLDWIDRAASAGEIVGVGETGLDYYRLDDADHAQRALQRERFSQHLDIAARHRLPVVVHTRSAAADTLAVMRGAPTVIGVMHCFTETWEVADAALALGYYVSISGIVTFKNADVIRGVAKRVPEDRLLVETDSPWLAPVPKRGKPNEPAFVAHTARFVAELRGVTLEALERSTTDNFFRLFGRARVRD